MFQSNKTTRILRASVTTVVCAALLTTEAMAGPKLQTIDVTPAAKTISVGQKQSFTATGTFSNGSKHVLGPGLSNIAPGGVDTCAVLTSGGVECWGYGGDGELGDGSSTTSFTPVRVIGISTATTLATGDIHSCALLVSGAVMCWGLNAYGQLGNGTSGDIRTSPVTVRGISTATAVAVGTWHSCALLAGGAVQCWGFNDSGQLGDGTGGPDEYSATPVSVTGISEATALALGNYHSCARLASGAVKCWGSNGAGELGNGTDTASNKPVLVSGIRNATAVVAGNWFSCALLATGAVRCWGQGHDGQLGDGSYTDSYIPVNVIGISTAIGITAGGTHVCVRLRAGAVKCWGSDGYGQLGDGTSDNYSNIPVLVRGINSPIRLAAGAEHTCALFSGGMMSCWGINSGGQLGLGWWDLKAHPLPVTVAGTPGVVWTSSDASRATINDRGIATGRAAGNTTISATTAGFINDNAVLTVK